MVYEVVLIKVGCLVGSLASCFIIKAMNTKRHKVINKQHLGEVDPIKQEKGSVAKADSQNSFFPDDNKQNYFINVLYFAGVKWRRFQNKQEHKWDGYSKWLIIIQYISNKRVKFKLWRSIQLPEAVPPWHNLHIVMVLNITYEYVFCIHVIVLQIFCKNIWYKLVPLCIRHWYLRTRYYDGKRINLVYVLLGKQGVYGTPAKITRLSASYKMHTVFFSLVGG